MKKWTQEIVSGLLVVAILGAVAGIFVDEIKQSRKR